MVEELNRYVLYADNLTAQVSTQFKEAIANQSGYYYVFLGEQDESLFVEVKQVNKLLSYLFQYNTIYLNKLLIS